MAAAPFVVPVRLVAPPCKDCERRPFDVRQVCAASCESCSRTLVDGCKGPDARGNQCAVCKDLRQWTYATNPHLD